jgi:hypothetical protein
MNVVDNNTVKMVDNSTVNDTVDKQQQVRHESWSIENEKVYFEAPPLTVLDSRLTIEQCRFF